MKFSIDDMKKIAPSVDPSTWGDLTENAKFIGAHLSNIKELLQHRLHIISYLDTQLTKSTDEHEKKVIGSHVAFSICAMMRIPSLQVMLKEFMDKDDYKAFKTIWEENKKTFTKFSNVEKDK